MLKAGNGSSGLAAAGLILAASCLVCAGLRAAEKPQRLAIANVSFIFEHYNKVADIERSIESRFEPQKKQFEERAQQLSHRIDELKPEIEGNTQSLETFDKVQALRKEQFIYERELDELKKKIRDNTTKEMREVLSDMRAAIKAVAETGGFDLVLRSPDSDDPQVAPVDPKSPPNPAAADQQTLLQRSEPRTAAELTERFNRNPVLFGAQAADITNQVLKNLNEEYARRSRLDKGPLK
jgi:Skp family chaperone for outer membrane proteins